MASERCFEALDLNDVMHALWECFLIKSWMPLLISPFRSALSSIIESIDLFLLKTLLKATCALIPQSHVNGCYTNSKLPLRRKSNQLHQYAVHEGSHPSLPPFSICPDILTYPHQFLCHCHDDRKITGSMFTASLVVPAPVTTISGTLKTFSKVVDSGHVMVNHFCGECGTTLYRRSDDLGMTGIVVIKVGTVDDEEFVEGYKPELEQFVRSRVSWVKGVEGAEQVEEGWAP